MDDSKHSVCTLDKFDTQYSADSVEWCPTNGYEDLIACGTYQLKKSDDSADGQGCSDTERLGKVYLLQLVKDKLKLLQCLECPAVLDQKWSYSSSVPTLGVALASGFVSIYCIVQSEGIPQLEKREDVQVAADGLALSLDWSSRVHASDDLQMSVSSSVGEVSIIKDAKCTENWKAHEFESWITAFNYWNTNVVWTGGDDCKLKVWDRRTIPVPIFTSRKHSMGVCSLHCHPYKEHMMASGSYDEHVLIWDTRQMKSPVSDTHIGGGVWRLKWCPHGGDKLLTAAMHNGFHIIDCSSTINDGHPIIVSYMEHESLAYGVDWCHMEGSSVIASCSFYDHLLHLWKT